MRDHPRVFAFVPHSVFFFLLLLLLPIVSAAPHTLSRGGLCPSRTHRSIDTSELMTRALYE